MTSHSLRNIALVLLLGLTSAACAPTLRPVTSESQLENEIAHFIHQKTGWTLSIAGEPNDQAVYIGFEGDDDSEFAIIIDTQVSAAGNAERVVLLHLLSGVAVNEGSEQEVLERLNAHHAEHWTGTFFIDEEDNGVHGNWGLNIPGTPIPTEVVFDGVVRLMSTWQDLRKDLMKDDLISIVEDDDKKKKKKKSDDDEEEVNVDMEDEDIAEDADDADSESEEDQES